MITIGITGTLGAGKGTIVDYLVKNRGFVHYSVRAFITEEIKKRGMEVNRALAVLRFSKKAAAANVEQLLRSAIANWEAKNGRKADEGELYISRIFVDEGVTWKRMRPAPQGRGYRIRKRSNHVTLFVDSNNNDENK